MRQAMRRHVAAMSLHARLSGLVALAVGLTALLGMVSVIGTGWWLQQERAREDAHEVVLTLSYALQASLAFDDKRGVAETLAIPRARPEIAGAWVYDAQGRMTEMVPPDWQGATGSPTQVTYYTRLADQRQDLGDVAVDRALALDGVGEQGLGLGLERVER